MFNILARIAIKICLKDLKKHNRIETFPVLVDIVMNTILMYDYQKRRKKMHKTVTEINGLKNNY